MNQKSVLELNYFPQSCNWCPCFEAGAFFDRCNALRLEGKDYTIMNRYQKLKDCPLKEVEQVD